MKDVHNRSFDGGDRYMGKWLENLSEKNEKIRYMKHVEKKSEMIHLLRREENNQKKFAVHKCMMEYIKLMDYNDSYSVNMKYFM